MEEMSNKEDEKIESLSFDSALEELEERVKLLEEGKLPLEEALECFKEGIGLVRICSSKLQDAETVIKQLMVGENGTVIETPPDLDRGGE